MTEQQNPLKHCIFISLPSSMERDIGSFHVDSSIKIPVQLPDGKTQIDNSTEISLELIVSGMLKIIAYNWEHEHASYYRDFVLAVQPDAPQELTLAAIAQEKKGNYPFAEELFLSVIRLAPQSASFINLATLYSRMATQDEKKGEVWDLYQQKMLNTLQEGLELVGEDAALYSEIGFFHLYQGNVELAKEYLDHYLSLAEDDEKKRHVQKIMRDINTKLNDDAQLMQAYDSIQMNDEEKALELLSSYLKNNEGVWNAWFLKGWALRRLSRFQEAEQALVQALAYTKGSSDIYNELALCSLETGKSELAKTYLNTAVDLDQENITLVSNLAYLHLKDGELDDARKYLELARGIDPKDPVIIQLMQDYQNQSGEALSSPVVEEYVSAEEVINQVKEEKPFSIQGREDTDDLLPDYSFEDEK
ncbi:MAG: tetratricopeptide repeat protein [Sphaerochaeta sp.]